MIINQSIKNKKLSPYSVVLVPHGGKTHPTGVLETLLNTYETYNPADNNPSTNLHELVEKINNLTNP